MTDNQRVYLHAGLEGQGNQPLVRPKARTGGRTRRRYQVAIEALVSTTADPAHVADLLPGQRRICDLCREVKSVAEVSALLSIPLGATRLLVAELAAAGLVAVHQAGDGNPSGPPEATLLERVLNGLRNDEAVERWLADGCQAVVDDLGHALDTEAGLREVLLQHHHDAAVDSLDDVLDVEAGLREALGVQADLDT
ncbi:hypothetical protein SBI_01486 [Streptomyces bingchenggensis BCW-1]|uniref:DUF742 domain-containing protein n=1 Tax=Streptomyces bingchenggensis (strain BCW-1) TaxID=749414 RepID=D7CDU2_STRBB|nr:MULTISPECIES: DUF742 domain-containing protein [Streptomyces]ADI04607.1 hypothetical protein SBI_01486 [Streptomyces bingchenggensis BCW-1]